MKRIFTFLCLAMLIKTTSGQGLDSIFVEKIPVYADAIAEDPNLNSNSITYRVFVDMAEGYRLSNISGLAQNPAYFKTTTKFYNNMDDGDVFPVFKAIPVINDPLYYDSWLTIGSYGKNAAQTQILPLFEDKDGTVNGFAFPANPPTIQTSLDPATNLEPFFGYEMGSSADGTVAGWDPENIIWYAAGGLPGIGASNSICIGQFTTDGDFSMELSVQLVKDATPAEIYVLRVANPDFYQRNSNWMVYPNIPPSVTLTAPIEGQSFKVGQPVTISADASDSDGSITKVQFIVNGFEVESDTESPFTFSWTMGQTDINQIIAIAFDNKFARDSSNVTISQNSSPTVIISSPSNGAEYNTGDIVSLAATAADANGSVSKVEFFLNSQKVGEDSSSPFEFLWTATPGDQSFTATATDNLGASATSTSITFSVKVPGNTNPSVTITSPSTGNIFVSGDQVLISASTSDPDPSDLISKVEFLINNVVTNEDTQAPYEFTWNSTGGGEIKIKAKSYDSNGGSTTSEEVAINLNVAPMITPTNPLEGSKHILNQIVLLSADAFDADGIKKVEFYVNDLLVGTDYSQPFSFNYISTSTGSKTIKMIATDNLNGSKESEIINISVDLSIGLEKLIDKSEVLVYPNPMSDYFFIETDGINSYIYSVSDLTGKKVLNGKIVSEKGRSKCQIEMSEFPDGLYLIRVQASNGNYNSVKKIIKSKK